MRSTLNAEEVNMINHLLTTAAVVLALAMPAWAQTATDQPAQPSATEELGTQATDQSEGTVATPEAIIPEQEETQLRAENLMGIEVVDLNGERIGEVTDLIFDENQKVTGVVVGVGGFLGIGKKEVGLKLDPAAMQEEPDTGQKTIVVNLNRTDFEAAPDFLTKEEREANERAEALQQQQQQQLQLQQQQQAPAAGDAGTIQ